VVGKPGRRIVSGLLSNIRNAYKVDFVIANAENASGGFGVTPKVVTELLDYGIEVLTSGNHVWDKKEIIAWFDKDKKSLLRPANYPAGNPGTGSVVVSTASGEKIGILNIIGRVFMASVDCPFRTAIKEVDKLRQETNTILVDIHAEATSEKVAMGWFLDGKVSAVVGTHTHIPTADETILPEGTAYITDVGMTGAMDSVIGMKKEIIIERFLTQRPQRSKVAKGNVELNAVIIDVDPQTGRSTSIKRLRMDITSVHP